MGGFGLPPPPSPAALELRTPPSPDPLATLAQMGEIQARRQEMQQRAALFPVQQQTAQLQQQQLKLDLEQRQKMNAAFQQAYETDPNGGMTLNPEKVMQGLATSGAGAAIPEVGQRLAALQKSYADLADTRQKVAALEADAAGRLGAIVHAGGDDPALFHSLIGDAVTQKHLEPGHATALDQAVTQTYQQDPSGQAARAMVKQIADQFIAGSPKQQELAKTKAETTEATEKTRRQKLVTDLMEKAQTAPQGGQHPIDAIFPASSDPQINASYKAAYNAAAAQPPDENGRRPALDSIVSAAAAHAASIAMPQNPQVRAGEVAKAVATEQATAPYKRANAVAEAKALREGDNPALAGVPPAAAQFAVSGAAKLDADYIKAREATESMGKLLDLADSKNVAAGANIPLAGVGAVNAINGIRRINSAEISQYGTAGSLLQKIQGKLEGWTEGQPIPASVRDDIRELHQQLGESAYSAYTQGIDSLNKRTGAKFGPTVPAPNIRKGAGALTPADAQGYLKKTGWTGGAPTPEQKAKAAALAKADGRTF